MARAFTKIGREISMAVKQGGPDPASNPRLRVAIQNAKGANMPKDNVESAIKRASAKDAGDFQEIVYEGYGPNGVALIVECATDNPTRTVANVRMYFTRSGGSLGTSGSLDFMFDRKSVFTLPAEGLNMEELELELIDFGAEDITVDEGSVYITTAFTDFGTMQRALEERGLAVTSSQVQRLPTTTTVLTEEQEEAVMALIEKLEDDDDVQAVFHNIA